MWMTGFDVPCCSTLYLDKPMRNHTLMQTIARANRVFPQKNNGLIVDYVGVFRNLQKALAIYGSAAGGGVAEGDTPVLAKEELIAKLREAVEEATRFCERLGIDLGRFPGLRDFDRVKFLDEAVEAILVNDQVREEFTAHANRVNTLFKAALPDRAANEFYPKRMLLMVLAEKVRSLLPTPDISEVMREVERLLDESVAAEAYVIRETRAGRYVDLSEINIEAIRKRFETGQKRTEAERLRRLLEGKVREMLQLNKTRMDYLEKLEQMIEEYNSGSLNVETFFQQLVDFSRQLREEEQRSIAENLSEEELAVFDLLMKPDMKLTQKDEAKVKVVAKELLETLKREKLVLDWRKRQQSQAAVRLCVAEILDRLPAVYDRALYDLKCNAVYQHIYDSYYGRGASVYAAYA
jgi:type I restriction enzyme R subunit